MSRSLRIVMVAACPYPTTQGTQVYIRGLCRALVDAGHEVHVVTYHFGEESLPPCGAQIHRIPTLPGYSKLRAGPAWGKPILDLLLLRRLLEVVRKVEPDILHAHNYEAPIAAYIARRLEGVPVVYSSHNLMVDELETYFEGRVARYVARASARFLDRQLPRRADRCITLSREAGPALSELGLDPARIDFIPPGLHPDEFPGPRAEAPTGSLRVVYAGNPDGYQDLDLLFRAMKQVAKSVPDVRLRIISSAALDSTLTLASQCGLDPALVEPFTCTDWEQVKKLMRECDVAALPRRVCRGFPIKLLNYLALGLPVVACEGSAKLLLEGKTGLVVPPEPSQFAVALCQLLADREEAFRMGLLARSSTLMEQDWRLRVPEFERVYAATLGVR